jgi:hypothetical protein
VKVQKVTNKQTKIRSQVQARMKMLAKATIQTPVVFAGKAPLLDLPVVVDEAVEDDVVEGGTGNVEVTTAEVAARLAVALPSSTVKYIPLHGSINGPWEDQTAKKDTYSYQSQAGIFDIIGKVENTDTDIRLGISSRRSKWTGLGIQKHNVTIFCIYTSEVHTDERVATYRWGPLPVAGAGPAYFVMAVAVALEISVPKVWWFEEELVPKCVPLQALT